MIDLGSATTQLLVHSPSPVHPCCLCACLCLPLPQPYGIGVKHRTGWLSWVGDWSAWFEVISVSEARRAAGGDGSNGGSATEPCMLQRGDTIISINGASVLGLSQDDFVARLSALDPTAAKPVTMLALRKDWALHVAKEEAFARTQSRARKAAAQRAKREQEETNRKESGREYGGSHGEKKKAGEKGEEEAQGAESESGENGGGGGRSNGGEGGNDGPEKPDFSSANPYDILLVDQDATLPQIKKAYRTLSLRYHPDKNLNDADATRRFIAIQAAYVWCSAAWLGLMLLPSLEAGGGRRVALMTHFVLLATLQLGNQRQVRDLDRRNQTCGVGRP